MQAATLLHVLDRSAFLASMAARLRHDPEVGPGTVNRVIRELLATKQSGSKRRLRSVETRGPRGITSDPHCAKPCRSLAREANEPLATGRLAEAPGIN
jgi:hypothetical protein